MSSLAIKSLAAGSALVAGLVAFILVQPNAQTGTAPASPPASATGGSAVVAEVGGERITASELDRSLGTALDKLQQQVYDLRRDRLDALIAEKIARQEAARRGITVDQLLQTEVAPKVAPVTQQDVDQFFEANKARIPADQPDIKDQIRRYLQGQRTQQAQAAYLRDLRAKAAVTVSLPPPEVTRHEVVTADAPARGPADAPVTIVEFTDFHCPFCRRVQPTLDELLKKYPTQVRLVFKDLPLDSLHPQARQAAEAARCAGDQGKFWPFHDQLFARGPDATPAALKAIATETGLDVAAFEQCTASGKHREGVQRDVQEAQRLGAEGTPAFLINGRFLSGAQPLEAFVRVVDEELQLKQGAR